MALSPAHLRGQIIRPQIVVVGIGGGGNEIDYVHCAKMEPFHVKRGRETVNGSHFTSTHIIPRSLISFSMLYTVYSPDITSSSSPAHNSKLSSPLSRNNIIWHSIPRIDL